jgi:hypothetical protein
MNNITKYIEGKIQSKLEDEDASKFEETIYYTNILNIHLVLKKHGKTYYEHDCYTDLDLELNLLLQIENINI